MKNKIYAIAIAILVLGGINKTTAQITFTTNSVDLADTTAANADVVKTFRDYTSAVGNAGTYNAPVNVKVYGTDSVVTLTEIANVGSRSGNYETQYAIEVLTKAGGVRKYLIKEDLTDALTEKLECLSDAKECNLTAEFALSAHRGDGPKKGALHKRK